MGCGEGVISAQHAGWKVDCNVCDLDADAEGHTCGDRIKWLKSPAGGTKSDTDARAVIAQEFPDACGACVASGSANGSTSGDGDGTTGGGDSVCDLDADAGGHSCGNRINWLKSPAGGLMSDTDARALVAQEFSSMCGACAASSGSGSNSTTDGSDISGELHSSR